MVSFKCRKCNHIFELRPDRIKQRWQQRGKKLYCSYYTVCPNCYYVNTVRRKIAKRILGDVNDEPIPIDESAANEEWGDVIMDEEEKVDINSVEEAIESAKSEEKKETTKKKEVKTSEEEVGLDKPPHMAVVEDVLNEIIAMVRSFGYHRFRANFFKNIAKSNPEYYLTPQGLASLLTDLGVDGRTIQHIINAINPKLTDAYQRYVSSKNVTIPPPTPPQRIDVPNVPQQQHRDVRQAFTYGVQQQTQSQPVGWYEPVRYQQWQPYQQYPYQPYPMNQPYPSYPTPYDIRRELDEFKREILREIRLERYRERSVDLFGEKKEEHGINIEKFKEIMKEALRPLEERISKLEEDKKKEDMYSMVRSAAETVAEKFSKEFESLKNYVERRFEKLESEVEFQKQIRTREQELKAEFEKQLKERDKEIERLKEEIRLKSSPEPEEIKKLRVQQEGADRFFRNIREAFQDFAPFFDPIVRGLPLAIIASWEARGIIPEGTVAKIVKGTQVGREVIDRVHRRLEEKLRS